MNDSKKTRIYIVDDEAAVLKAISQTVRCSGYQVSSFRSAEECLIIF